MFPFVLANIIGAINHIVFLIIDINSTTILGKLANVSTPLIIPLNQ